MIPVAPYVTIGIYYYQCDGQTHFQTDSTTGNSKAIVPCNGETCKEAK